MIAIPTDCSENALKSLDYYNYSIASTIKTVLDRASDIGVCIVP